MASASSIAGHVVVVTGASGGLGRETARQFAAEGCRIALAARRRDSLEETAEICRGAGGDPFVQATDVTSENDVNALVAAVLARWGRIDVWVNNAGVTLFATLEQGSFDEHRRVIETNLFGPIYAARAVVPVFRRQRRGVMINVGSVLSMVGQPAVPSYVISKFALRGLSEALRMELADEPDIHVSTILPYAIDTPHFQSGASEIGARAFAMPPVQTPEEVAREIVRLAKRPRREVLVPRIAAAGLALRWLLPRTTERLILHAIDRWHLREAEPPKSGNLFRATDEHGSVHGRRKPRVSTLGFATWVVGDLAWMQAAAAWRWIRPMLARREASRPRPADRT